MNKIKIEKIKVNTSHSIIVVDGEVFDFRKCSTLKDLRDKIIDEVIPLCRKCAFAQFCKFYKKDEPCRFQKRFIENYLISTIRFIPKNSAAHIKEYLEYTLHILRLLENFNNWQGGILDKDILEWQGEAILSIDKYWLKKINLEIAYIIDKYFFIQPSEKDFYRFKIFVEGKDDKRAFIKVAEKLNFYIPEDRIEYLEGEGKVKIMMKYVQKIISEGIDVFFLMDNKGNWYKEVKKKLVNKNLINEKEQVFKFKKSLEDSYPWNIQKEAFLSLEIQEELKKKINDNFFKERDAEKIVDKIHKILFNKVNFKKNLKERFNQALLKIFLEKENILESSSELVKKIKQVLRSINKRKKSFYYKRR